MNTLYGSESQPGYQTRGTEESICVDTNSEGAPNPAYFLAEDLYILPYQIYRRKIEGPFNSAMIKKACRSPGDNVSAILHEGIAAMGLKLKGPPKFLQEAGVNIDSKILKVPVRVIPSPALSFSAGQKTDVSKKHDVKEGNKLSTKEYVARGLWQLDTDVKFLANDKSVSGRPYFLISKKHQDSQVPNSLHAFWEHYTANGAPDMGQLTTKFDRSNSWAWNGWDQSTLEKVVNAVRKNLPGIIIMVLPKNNKQHQVQYAHFKAAMDQAGIDSLCLCEEKLTKKYGMRDPHNSTSEMANYAYNVGMKLNVRFGNTNHSLESSNFPILPKTTTGTCDTIILGADVIHPGMSSVEGTPSIAALVGSVDGHYGKYYGSIRTQPYDKTRQSTEVIAERNMRAMANERLGAWKNANGGRYPTNILYYRDSVSDSQFTPVLEKEVHAICAAWNDCVKGTLQSGVAVKITTVVVVKRHNVRLYPSTGGEQSHTGNVLPGTVVDSGITHPYNFDFFLVSHEGLQGTVRPTHYVVLQNEMGFDATQIQDLTHRLCFTYQRSTTSVSYVPPAYYADHLCERGRCYLKDLFDGAPSMKNWNVTQVEQEIGRIWAKGGRRNGNPWHSNLDEKMFWM